MDSFQVQKLMDQLSDKIRIMYGDLIDFDALPQSLRKGPKDPIVFIAPVKYIPKTTPERTSTPEQDPTESKETFKIKQQILSTMFAKSPMM